LNKANLCFSWFSRIKGNR